MGVLKLQEGDYSGAFKDYNQALSIDPKFAEAYCNRGNVQYKLKNRLAAIADYTLAIQFKKNFPEAYFNRGTLHSCLGDYLSAIADFEMVLSLDSVDAKAYYNLGNAFHRLGKLQIALDNYSEAIKIDDQYADAYGNRGLALNKMHDTLGAVSDLRIAAGLYLSLRNMARYHQLISMIEKLAPTPEFGDYVVQNEVKRK